MKLLSVAIPCYNSQDYMRRAVESLLPGGENVEILIVNDGSTDGTAQIAGNHSINRLCRQPFGHLPGLTPTLFVEFALRLPLHNLTGIIHSLSVSYQEYCCH